VSGDALKGVIAGSIGVILAILQYAFNIFSTALISHPDWPPSFGFIAIVIGTFLTIFAAVRWPTLSQQSRDKYFLASLALMTASVFGCIAFRYVMEVTLFATRNGFVAVYYSWLCVFFIFAASFVNMIGAGLLYVQIDVTSLIKSLIKKLISQ
jgi:hypothetical protein